MTKLPWTVVETALEIAAYE